MATFDKINKIARAEIGYHEGRSGGHWNNDQKYSDELPGFKWSDGQAWCATFVCWVFWKVGVYGLLPSPSAGCDQLAAGFKKNGRWSEYPAKGAVVFYGIPSDLSHTGIVVDYDDDNIYVVEGNTNNSGSREGDGVYLKTRRRRDAYVVGYGYPKFPEGIESADPSYARVAEKPEKAPQAPAKPKAKPMPTVSLSKVVRAARVASWMHNMFSKAAREDVRLVVRALKAEDCRNYRQWQVKCGYTGADADGVPGKASLTRLGRRNGFRVVQ